MVVDQESADLPSIFHKAADDFIRRINAHPNVSEELKHLFLNAFTRVYTDLKNRFERGEITTQYLNQVGGALTLLAQESIRELAYVVDSSAEIQQISQAYALSFWQASWEVAFQEFESINLYVDYDIEDLKRTAFEIEQYIQDNQEADLHFQRRSLAKIRRAIEIKQN